MYSLNLKRKLEADRRAQEALEALLNPQRTPQAKKDRMQKIYGKSSDDMALSYRERVEDFQRCTLPTQEWQNNYGKSLSNALTFVGRERVPEKELGRCDISIGSVLLLMRLDISHMPRCMFVEDVPVLLTKVCLLSRAYAPRAYYKGGGLQIQVPENQQRKVPLARPIDHGLLQHERWEPSRKTNELRKRQREKELHATFRFQATTQAERLVDALQRQPPTRSIDAKDNVWPGEPGWPIWRQEERKKWMGDDFLVAFQPVRGTNARLKQMSGTPFGPSLMSAEDNYKKKEKKIIETKTKTKEGQEGTKEREPHEKSSTSCKKGNNIKININIKQPMPSFTTQEKTTTALKKGPSYEEAAIAQIPASRQKTYMNSILERR